MKKIQMQNKDTVNSKTFIIQFSSALFFLCLLILFCSVNAKADSWYIPSEKVVKNYKFGQTTIELIADATKNSKYPDYILKISNEQGMLAQYRNISFSKIFATKGNDFFIGLSNSGIPGTAIVIFNSKGDLILEIKHGYGQFEYCEKSITVIRQWYDNENPGFRVEYADNKVRKIYINKCNGKQISLQEVINRAYGKAIKGDGEIKY